MYFYKKIIVKLLLFVLAFITPITFVNAATYNSQGVNIEKQFGYISLDKINSNLDRFFNIVNHTNLKHYYYIDLDSIQVIVNTDKQFVIKSKLYIVNYDEMHIALLDSIFFCDMVNRGHVDTVVSYQNIYDFEGNFLVTSSRTPTREHDIGKTSPGYMTANFLFNYENGVFYDKEAMQELIYKEGYDFKL